MPKRSVFLEGFGHYLVSLREALRWKQAQAADIAKRRGIAVTYQALRGLEEGTTKSPDPELLRAIAALYELPYPELVRRYVHERYGVDLTPDEFALMLQDRFGAAPNRVALEKGEADLLDAWRLATREGRRAAMAVLTVSKRSKRTGKKTA
jgi:transcriptional regulator with XRE-family HTH domain